MKLPYYMKCEETIDGYTKKESDRIDKANVHTIGYRITIRPMRFFIFKLMCCIRLMKEGSK